MKRVSSCPALAALLLALAPLLPALAQNPTTRPAPAAQNPREARPAPTPEERDDNDDDDVVRITSNLVQIDVTVTDKAGRPVTDLRPEEFEVSADGRPQEVTGASFVSAGEGAAGAGRPREAAKPADKLAPPAPPARLRPEQVRRTIALVADDLGTSFESMHFVREGLKKFVNEQMRPGDLVAIIRTSAGMGSLQQFTSDKRILLRAIERVRWTPRGRGGVSAFAPIEADPVSAADAETGLSGGRRRRGGDRAREERQVGDDVDEFREDIFAVGTLGALNFIIKGLKELPGRKSVIMFSDGFEIYRRDGQNDRIIERLRRLVDLATRSAVVVSTVDARGLPILGLTAADSTSGLDSAQIEQALFDRRDNYFNTQAGLSYLAEATGGIFVRNNNDLGDGVRRVLEAQRDYYLIGFRPEESLFDQKRGRVRFNSIKVGVKRPGLRVRTRGGFYGFTEREARPVRRTRAEQIAGALSSPFTAGEVPLRLTSLFGSEAADKQAVVSLLHIDVSGFRFEQEADGWNRAVMDVVALTFGEGGQLIDEVNRTETIRARGDAYRTLMEQGLTFTMQVPIKKPGAYHLRVVVRDAASEKLGSASQFIEVPDLKKNRLALSGLALSGAGGGEGGEGGAAAPADAAGGPAVRRFRRGATFDYYYDIYNARAEKATGRPQLTAQTRVFRDGQPVYEGPVRPFAPGDQTDMRRLRSGSRVTLSRELQPGEYLLQVVVRDEMAKEKHRVATQWIDFEIVD